MRIMVDLAEVYALTVLHLQTLYSHFALVLSTQEKTQHNRSTKNLFTLVLLIESPIVPWSSHLQDNHPWSVCLIILVDPNDPIGSAYLRSSTIFMLPPDFDS